MTVCLNVGEVIVAVPVRLPIPLSVIGLDFKTWSRNFNKPFPPWRPYG